MCRKDFCSRLVCMCMCVCVCVCVSVCVCVCLLSHITCRVSVRPENTVMYSAGNKGQKIVEFALKTFRCRDPALLN